MPSTRGPLAKVYVGAAWQQLIAFLLFVADLLLQRKACWMFSGLL